MQSTLGPTQGLGITSIGRLKDRIVISFSPITNEQEGIYCRKLVNDCGVTVRIHAQSAILV